MHPHADAHDRKDVPARPEWILALAGFCLILLQFFTIREVTSLLHGTELVILLVTVAYFSGYSVGYAVAGRIAPRRLKPLLLAGWALHLTIPFSFRYVGGWLTENASVAALAGLLFLTAFLLSSFFSVLLPLLIDAAADGAQSLVRYYSSELLGALAALAALFVTAKAPWAALVLYQLALATLVTLLWGSPRAGAVAFAGAIAYAALFSSLDRRSLEYRFASIHGFLEPESLYSVSTLYQKVDFVRSGGATYIFLDGLEFYGTDMASRYNTVVSRIPALLVAPDEALVLGSGSMESVRHLAPLAKSVTTVEIDPAVIDGSRRFLANVNQVDRADNWTLVVDDAKRYLATTDRSFDLIVEDVPCPDTIQVGLLHSVDFYRLAQRRLAPGGVLSVGLCAMLAPENETPRAIASTLATVFRDVIVYRPAGERRSYALAGDSLPFTAMELVDAAVAAGFGSARVVEAIELAHLTEGMPPITPDNLWLVITRSWSHLRSLHRPGAPE